jgi:hypothetical protein
VPLSDFFGFTVVKSLGSRDEERNKAFSVLKECFTLRRFLKKEQSWELKYASVFHKKSEYIFGALSDRSCKSDIKEIDGFFKREKYTQNKTLT